MITDSAPEEHSNIWGKPTADSSPWHTKLRRDHKNPKRVDDYEPEFTLECLFSGSVVNEPIFGLGDTPSEAPAEMIKSIGNEIVAIGDSLYAADQNMDYRLFFWAAGHLMDHVNDLTVFLSAHVEQLLYNMPPDIFLEIDIKKVIDELKEVIDELK